MQHDVPDGRGPEPHDDGTLPWRVCLRRLDGAVVGAGVLVDREHVLTCAHVVSAALATHPVPGRPPHGDLVAEFPFWTDPARSSSWRARAAVVPGGWVPLRADGRGDLALLRLREPAPEGLAPATLDTWPGGDRRSVLIFGHPGDVAEGVWAAVRLSGVAGPGGEWVQIDPESAVGRRVEQGFSGAGAIDERTGKVIGVVVAEDPTTTSRVAWVIRMQVVVSYLPRLAHLLGSPGRGASGALGSRAAADRPPGGVLERPLSDDELDTLFTHFWSVPAMKRREGRDFYLDALEQRLGEPVTVARQEEDRLDGWAILMALLERPGALRALARLLTTVHEKHHAVVEFAEHVEVTFPGLMLERAERAELEGYLAGVGWSRIGAAHRYATRHLGVLPTTAPMTAGEVIRDLEARARQGRHEVPALLVMVDDLAHVLGGRAWTELHRWVDGVGERLGVPLDRRRALCPEAEQRHAEPRPAHVVLTLTPDGVDPALFLLSAVVMVADEPERPVFRDDKPRTLAEIEAALDDVLRFVPEAIDGEADRLLIEFVLPDRLLDTPVERWEIDRGGFPLPIGIRYPVVVRSRDRMLGTGDHYLWHAKTRRLHDQGRRFTPGAVLPVSRDARTEPPEADEPRTVFAQLLEADEAVVLAVPFAPAAPPPDVFVAGVRAGVPAIVWARAAVEPAGFHQVVEGELLSTGPMDLPNQVWKYRLRRRGAMRPGTGDDVPVVGILFDEATRIPSQLSRPLRLRPPGPGGGQQ